MGFNMQRKIIQIADSTQLISLPRQWCKRFNLKKGEELNLLEKGNTIIINTNKKQKRKKIEINITKLDRSSIIYFTQSVYRLGYDEIEFTFDKQETVDVGYGKEVSFLEVIQYIINRLAGFEIIQQKQNMCLIKNIQEIKENDFDIILKRVFNIWQDCIDNLIDALNNNSKTQIKLVENVHDSITKFVSFCLRAINKRGITNEKKSLLQYHIIRNIDKTVDIMKHASRDILKYDAKLSKQSINIIEEISKSIRSYIEIYYKFDIEKVKQMNERRIKVMLKVRELAKKEKAINILVVDNLRMILEILFDLIESRWGMEY